MVQIEQLLVSNMITSVLCFPSKAGYQFPDSMYYTVSFQGPQDNFIRAVHNKDWNEW